MVRLAPTCTAGLLGAFLVLGLAAPADAQLLNRRTSTGNNLNVEHYDPPASPLGMANILESKAQTWREWSVGLYFNYARNQLVLFQDRLQVGEVIGHRLSADIVGSVGLFSWLEVGAVLPVTGFQSGDSGLPTGTFAASGLRDPRVHAKFTVISQERSGFLGVAVVPELSLPLGNDQAFLGDGGLVFSPMLVVDRSFDVAWGLRFAGTFGVRLRPRAEIGNIEVDDEAFYRVGAALGLPNWFDANPEVIGELNGITGLADLFQGKEQNPLSPTFATRWYWNIDWGHQMVTTAGVNLGATRGYGAPDYQVFVGVAYRRWLSDRDGDGIYDDDDYCPDDPEDKDQFEDLDGCPDPDNDKDGIPDVSDRCPLEPEDIDGFQDLDGCPDPDNDKDEILDVDDACPLDPEDYDGFQDDDGCPEPDNDLDGIPDEQDRCPGEKEVINGVDDLDGCPDEGEENVKVTSEKITINTKIYFEFDKAILLPESYPILDQVALVVLANPQLSKILIEGHTDDRGSDIYNLELSQRRAEAVMKYLLDFSAHGRKIEASRLDAVGYGEQRPIEPGQDERAWAINRRVEFTIVDQGAGAETGGRTLAPPGPVTAPGSSSGSSGSMTPAGRDIEAGESIIPMDTPKLPKGYDKKKAPKSEP